RQLVRHRRWRCAIGLEVTNGIGGGLHDVLRRRLAHPGGCGGGGSGGAGTCGGGGVVWGVGGGGGAGTDGTGGAARAPARAGGVGGGGRGGGGGGGMGEVGGGPSSPRGGGDIPTQVFPLRPVGSGHAAYPLVLLGRTPPQPPQRRHLVFGSGRTKIFLSAQPL